MFVRLLARCVRLGPAGPRVYIERRRIHHGLVGSLLIGFGLVLAWHDRSDFPWPLHD